MYLELEKLIDLKTKNLQSNGHVYMASTRLCPSIISKMLSLHYSKIGLTELYTKTWSVR